MSCIHLSCPRMPLARGLTALGVVLIVLGGCSGAGSASASDRPVDGPAQASADSAESWPLFRGDPAASGVARATLPKKLDVLWTFSVDDGWFESTAANVDGTVYVGSHDGNLYAIE